MLSVSELIAVVLGFGMEWLCTCPLEILQSICSAVQTKTVYTAGRGSQPLRIKIDFSNFCRFCGFPDRFIQSATV